MSLSKYEKETIINYNETDEPASVYTFNAALQRKLDKLALEYPEKVKCTGNTGKNCKEYLVPKEFVKVKPPRRISNNYRAKLAENARRNLGRGKGG